LAPFRGNASLHLPESELSFGGSSPHLALHRVVNGSRTDTELTELSDAAFVGDLETGEALRWDPAELSVIRHVVERGGERRPAVVGLGFDARPRWTTYVPGNVWPGGAVRLEGSVVVLVRPVGESFRLVSIAKANGAIEWTREL
jgi:hypothetical protein